MNTRGFLSSLTLLAAGVATISAGCTFLSASSAQAEDGALHVSLNTARTSGNACRLSFVFQNALGKPIKDASLELVVFLQDGTIDRFVQISTGALPARKTRAKQFDFEKLDCAKVEKVLLNDVKACVGESLTPALCLSKLSVSGGKSIKLIF